MDARVQKLTHKLDKDVAERLVRAGFDTPAKIRAARDADLRKIEGVGQGTLAAIRKRFASREAKAL